METAIEMKPNTLLTIDESAYFDVEKKQLYYQSEYYDDAKGETDAYNSVNRYA